MAGVFCARGAGSPIFRVRSLPGALRIGYALQRLNSIISPIFSRAIPMRQPRKSEAASSQQALLLAATKSPPRRGQPQSKVNKHEIYSSAGRQVSLMRGELRIKYAPLLGAQNGIKCFNGRYPVGHFSFAHLHCRKHLFHAFRRVQRRPLSTILHALAHRRLHLFAKVLPSHFLRGIKLQFVMQFGLTPLYPCGGLGRIAMPSIAFLRPCEYRERSDRNAGRNNTDKRIPIK